MDVKNEDRCQRLNICLHALSLQIDEFLKHLIRHGDDLGVGLKSPLGRNHLDELVPLGTYICHLEVVNEDTGKRTEKVAPIVVGTVLK